MLLPHGVFLLRPPRCVLRKGPLLTGMGARVQYVCGARRPPFGDSFHALVALTLPGAWGRRTSRRRGPVLEQQAPLAPTSPAPPQNCVECVQVLSSENCAPWQVLSPVVTEEGAEGKATSLKKDL